MRPMCRCSSARWPRSARTTAASARRCSRAWPQPGATTPLRDRRLAAADEAVAIAGRIGDPEILGVALEGRWIAIEGPDELAEGLGIPATES